MNITLTEEEISLILYILETDAYSKLHSYNDLKMIGAVNIMDIIEKIKKQIN